MTKLSMPAMSVVGRPCRKPACSGGSCGSITGSSIARSRRSRSFSGMHNNDIVIFAAPADLFGFWTAIQITRLSPDFWKSESIHALGVNISQPVQH